MLSLANKVILILPIITPQIADLDLNGGRGSESLCTSGSSSAPARYVPPHLRYEGGGGGGNNNQPGSAEFDGPPPSATAAGNQEPQQQRSSSYRDFKEGQRDYRQDPSYRDNFRG